jgi:hypothetical protein
VETGTCKDVDDGGVGGEVVVTEGFGLCPLIEVKSEVGFVFEVECDLGEISGGEGVWVEGVECVPTGFRTVVCEDGDSFGYESFSFR